MTVVVGHDIDVGAVQRRTLRLLFGTQIVGGVGVAIGIAVGALLAAAIAGAGASGLAASAGVVGAAVLAAPATTIMRLRGRRPGLVFSYLCGLLGALVVVLAAARHSIGLMYVGMFLFGGGTAANLQGRYVAVDLAEPARRGRQLSLVVWATTLGAVAGPNLAPLADRAMQRFGLREYSGPFAFSALAFGVAAIAIALLMRPDPLLTARALTVPDPPAAVTARALTVPDPPGAATARALTVSDPPGADPAASGPASRGADPPTGGPASWGADPAAGGPVSPGVEPAAGGHVSPGGAAAAGGEAVARAVADQGARTGLRAAVRLVAADPAARLGVAAVAVGHVVMVGVMSMTPVHIGGYVHAHGDVLRVVGIVLSLHIAGMYAFAPVTGWLTDRYGRRQVIVGGVVALLAACAVAGTAGPHTPRLSVGLALLGIGWSGTMVGGSTLLSESVPAALRPAAQGLSDIVMGFAGASAAALSGVVVDVSGYPTLALLAAVAAVPLAGLALRRPHRVVG